MKCDFTLIHSNLLNVHVDSMNRMGSSKTTITNSNSDPKLKLSRETFILKFNLCTMLKKCLLGEEDFQEKFLLNFNINQQSTEQRSQNLFFFLNRVGDFCPEVTHMSIILQFHVQFILTLQSLFNLSLKYKIYIHSYITCRNTD